MIYLRILRKLAAISAICLVASGCALFREQQMIIVSDPKTLEEYKKEHEVTSYDTVIVLGDFKNKKTETDEIARVPQKALENKEPRSRAAMYVLGTLYQEGSEKYHIEQDLAVARTWFEKSSMLGFAPAIHKLSEMILVEGNIHLHLCYLKMLTSLGHWEFTRAYNKIYYISMKKNAPDLFTKIENCAEYKLKLIHRMQDEFRASANKKEFIRTKLGQFAFEDSECFVMHRFFSQTFLFPEIFQKIGKNYEAFMQKNS